MPLICKAHLSRQMTKNKALKQPRKGRFEVFPYLSLELIQALLECWRRPVDCPKKTTPLAVSRANPQPS
jgi:hypothetical protein